MCSSELERDFTAESAAQDLVVVPLRRATTTTSCGAGMGDRLHHCSYDAVNGIGRGDGKKLRHQPRWGPVGSADTQVRSPSALPRVVSASPTAPLLRWILPCAAPHPARPSPYGTNACGTEGDNPVNFRSISVGPACGQGAGYPQKNPRPCHDPLDGIPARRLLPRAAGTTTPGDAYEAPPPATERVWRTAAVGVAVHDRQPRRGGRGRRPVRPSRQPDRPRRAAQPPRARRRRARRRRHGVRRGLRATGQTWIASGRGDRLRRARPQPAVVHVGRRLPDRARRRPTSTARLSTCFGQGSGRVDVALALARLDSIVPGVRVVQAEGGPHAQRRAARRRCRRRAQPDDLAAHGRRRQPARRARRGRPRRPLRRSPTCSPTTSNSCSGDGARPGYDGPAVTARRSDRAGAQLAEQLELALEVGGGVEVLVDRGEAQVRHLVEQCAGGRARRARYGSS